MYDRNAGGSICCALACSAQLAYRGASFVLCPSDDEKHRVGDLATDVAVSSPCNEEEGHDRQRGCVAGAVYDAVCDAVCGGECEHGAVSTCQHRVMQGSKA